MSTRDKIIEAARKEFMENGYEKISMRALAKKADLTTGAIYGIFIGKEDLYKACIDADIEYIKKKVYEQDQDFELPDDKDKREAYMKEYLEKVVTLLSELFTTYHTSLTILLRRGEGPIFDDFMNFLFQMKYDANMAYYKKSTKDLNPSEQIKSVIKVMSQSTINAVLEMVGKDWTIEERRLYLIKITTFQRAGWLTLG